MLLMLYCTIYRKSFVFCSVKKTIAETRVVVQLVSPGYREGADTISSCRQAPMRAT